MKQLILASQSPRRKELLKQLKIPFTIEVSNYKENIDYSLLPHQLAMKLSLKKAQKVAKNKKGAIIIAADTLVVYDNKIYGKPKDEKEAKQMLLELNGNVNIIITGFTILDSDSLKTVTKFEKTKVYMKKLTNNEIDKYIQTKEPLDKAGAYCIQDLGKKLIDKIEGDYNNAVGLPLSLVKKELQNFGIVINL